VLMGPSKIHARSLCSPGRGHAKRSVNVGRKGGGLAAQRRRAKEALRMTPSGATRTPQASECSGLLGSCLASLY